jgi:hypothetical protein
MKNNIKVDLTDEKVLIWGIYSFASGKVAIIRGKIVSVLNT